MEPVVSTFKSCNGIDDIYYRIWSCEGTPRAIIHLLHGMCEHGERYREMAEYFTARGFVFCVHDHTGHGASVSEKGMLGWMGPGDGIRTLIEDTRTMAGILKERFPGVGYVIYAHSMGSFIGRLFFKEYGSDCRGMIISGTAGANPFAHIVRALARLQLALAGDRKPARLIMKLLIISYLRRIKNPKTPCDWLSTDEKVPRDYLADPLCRYAFTHRGYIELMGLLIRCNRRDRFEAIPKNLPLLLISGEEDPVGGYGRGVRQVEKRLRRAGVRDVTARIFPGMRHEVHNETRRLEVFELVEGWLKGVL